MAENSDKLLLAIQADNTEGARLLGERWPDFVWTLQAMLREGGREEPEVRGELLLFRYPDPAAALNSLFSHLRQLKEQFHCEPSLGPLPLRIILHLEDGADDKIPPPVQLADPGGADWSGLRPETPHLSSRLRARWPELADQQKLGGFRLEAEQNGLSPLVAVTNPAGHPPLFPHRQLPLKGDKPPCFYCGLTTHEAARCPAKSLTMQTQGLPTVGYLPLAQLSELFLEAMTRQEELNGLLAAGVSPVQLRKDPLLRTYVSYLDLNKVFQPRFLAGIAFTSRRHWHELERPEPLVPENNDLFLGLDCLRVGKYRQADELFISEGRRPKGKELYAAVGRALVSLEQQRYQDMGHYLESALKMANSDRDRIYLNLLLSRYYRMTEESWKAAQALDEVLSLDHECSDALYRQLQLSVADGFTASQALGRLRALVATERIFFMQALMDPEMAPVQQEVEEILRTRLWKQLQEAEENLAQARALCHEMEQWLPEGEEELKTLRDDLRIIEQQESQKSYFDLIDVAEKSRLLVQRCHRLQEGRLDALHERLERTGRRLESFQRFWQSYPYQSFFPGYQETLQQMAKVVTKAGNDGMKNMHGPLYRSLATSLDQCDRDFAALQQRVVLMIWFGNLIGAGKRFLKSLVIAELVLVGLMVLLLVALLFLAPPAAATAGLTGLLLEPAIQKRLLLTVTLILAPAAALIHTLWRSLR